MALKCSKCGSEKFTVRKDSRGIAEARCAECDAYIKKMSVSEVVDYYEQRLAEDGSAVVSEEDNRQPCQFCKEYYFYRFGRMGTLYIPVEAKFCPICGRRLKPTDRDY